MESVGDLERLQRSFERHLRAENKSPKTVATYGESLTQLLAYLAGEDIVLARDIDREHVEAFMEHLLQTRSPATASVRFRALQQFFRWLVDDEHVDADPMAKMKVPLVPEQPVPILSEDDLRALLATRRSKSLEDRRDEAIIRTLADTGIRRNELLAIESDDVDLDMGVVNIVGKGRRRRQVPVGPKTARALDRYNNLRAQQTSITTVSFWLTGRGGRLQESGLATMLNRRGIRAGLGRIHPHQLRHTFAHAWLAQGGNEGDLMRLAGWRTREMLGRYGASAADTGEDPFSNDTTSAGAVPCTSSWTRRWKTLDVAPSWLRDTASATSEVPSEFYEHAITSPLSSTNPSQTPSGPADGQSPSLTNS